LSPEELERADLIDADVWPEYNRHGEILNPFWGRMLTELADYQFVVVDDDTGAFLAEGHTIPLRWDGGADGGLAGIDAAIQRCFEVLDSDGDFNAICAMAAEIPPGTQGKGLSVAILDAMKDIGRTRGFEQLVAPVRPNHKERYPLTPIERYVAWKRPDGTPFDPWIRVHVRLGAEVLAPLPRSMLISGSVREWEEWTGMRFPESGSYTFPRCLAPLEVDVEADRGTYWEPNVWIHHRIDPRR
jgi:hypothetical protein